MAARPKAVRQVDQGPSPSAHGTALLAEGYSRPGPHATGAAAARPAMLRSGRIRT